MSQTRLKKIALCAAVGIGLLLVFVAMLIAVEQRRTRAETGAVLSALFSQEVLQDMDKWREGRTVEVVILRNPDCSVCWVDGNGLDSRTWFAPSLRSRASALLDAWFAQSSRITRASFFLNSIFSADVRTELHLPSGAQAVFINRSDLGTKPGEFDSRFPNNLGFFVVSRVGLNLNQTEALLYFERLCAGLCGGGEYVLLRKVDGVWHVVDHRSTWVS